ncbi:MAG: response regulator [Calditrichaeota bacterium]|nr:MAG: response regulator [Calditrichota bacterium]
MDLEISRKVILLIDDDRSLHQIQHYVLTQHGFELISAYSGEDGLKLALREKPDIILMDYMMPGLSGEEVLAKINSEPQYQSLKSVPLVMLTAANHNDAHIKGLLRKGLAAYLCKPFGKNELINVLKNVLHKQEEALEEKQLMDQLLQSRDFFYNILSNFPGLLFTTNDLGEITYFTKGSSTFTSLNYSQLKGLSLWEVLNLDEREVADYFHDNQQVNFYKKETVFHDEERGELPIELTITPLKNNNSEVQGLLCIANDLITLRKLELERNEKEKIKGIVQAMATVNHEINNPLTPILGNLSLLISDTPHLSAEAVSKLVSIQESAEAIREKVYKMSTISKPIFKQYYKDEMIIDIENSE